GRIRRLIRRFLQYGTLFGRLIAVVWRRRAQPTDVRRTSAPWRWWRRKRERWKLAPRWRKRRRPRRTARRLLVPWNIQERRRCRNEDRRGKERWRCHDEQQQL